jgi:hypothetical protein
MMHLHHWKYTDIRTIVAKLDPLDKVFYTIMPSI